MSLKNHAQSGEHLLAKHHAIKGEKREKYAGYRTELKRLADEHQCADLLKIKNQFREKHSDALEDPPEILEAMAKARQITIEKALQLLENSGQKLPKSIIKAIERRRLLIFMASVGDESGKSHGKIQQIGDWDPQSETFNDGAIVIDNEYIGNYIGTAGVIAHELRHIMDCEESKWDEKTNINGEKIREKLDTGVVFGTSDLGLNNNKAQGRANIYSGGVLAALGWNPDQIWAKMSTQEKNALRATWGPNWDGIDGSSGTGSTMDEKMRLYLDKFEKAKSKLKTRKCARICRHKEYGICDREVFFPPCHDHR